MKMASRFPSGSLGRRESSRHLVRGFLTGVGCLACLVIGDGHGEELFELFVVPGREAHRLEWDEWKGAGSYSVWWSDGGDPRQRGELIAQTEDTSLVHEPPRDVSVSHYLVEAHLADEEVRSPVRSAGRFEFQRMRFFSPMVVRDFDGNGLPEFLLGSPLDDREASVPMSDRGLASARPYPFFRARSGVGDFDADGDEDVMVAPYGPPGGTPLGQRPGRLYFNDGAGHFQESLAFLKNQVMGWSETPVAADFDNDGDLDLYIPVYPNKVPDKNWLLLNDGTGRFHDVAEEAGLAGELWPLPEGAQAVDINRDGWLDLYVSSRFYINEGPSEKGVPRFREARFGLEERFDEGAKLIDWNRDGQWDLVENHPSLGPVLYESKGTGFRQVPLPDLPREEGRGSSWGLYVGDINHDGWSDFFFPGGEAGGQPLPPRLYINTKRGFRLSDAISVDGLFAWSGVLADFDANGSLDVAMLVAEPNTKLSESVVGVSFSSSPGEIISVDMRDINGQANQQGREVRLVDGKFIEPLQMRLVDGGSGWLAHAPYPVSFSVSPGSSGYRVEVGFAERLVTVEGVRAGARLVVFADGEVAEAGFAEAVADAPIVEGHEDGAQITVRLEGRSLVLEISSPFGKRPEAPSAKREDVWISGLPRGVSLGGVEALNERTLRLTLDGNAEVDYDREIGLMRLSIDRRAVKNARWDLDVRSSIRLLPANDAPVMVEAPSSLAFESYPYRAVSVWEDDEGETMTLTLVSGPEWLEIDEIQEGRDFQFVGEPPVGSRGSYEVLFEVSDASGGVTQEAFELKVRPVPEPISFPEWVRTFEDETVVESLRDPEGDADGDDHANLLEFALGGDPLRPGGLPSPEVYREGTDLLITLTHTRLTRGVDYELQRSSGGTLRDWEAVNRPMGEEKNRRGRITRQWRLPLLPGDEERQYRVVVRLSGDE